MVAAPSCSPVRPPFNALLLEALITVYELYFELYTDLVPHGKKIRMNIFGEKDI